MCKNARNSYQRVIDSFRIPLCVPDQLAAPEKRNLVEQFIDEVQHSVVLQELRKL
jgi:hypothetical protein